MISDEALRCFALFCHYNLRVLGDVPLLHRVFIAYVETCVDADQ